VYCEYKFPPSQQRISLWPWDAPAAQDEPGGLRVTGHWAGDVLIAEVHGELDVATEAAFVGRMTAVVARNPAGVVVDLHDTWCDVRGLAALLTSATVAAEQDVPLVFARLSSMLTRITHLAGVDHALPRFGTVEEALAGLGGGRDSSGKRPSAVTADGADQTGAGRPRSPRRFRREATG
jgi:anti-anti-sigma factor